MKKALLVLALILDLAAIFLFWDHLIGILLVVLAGGAVGILCYLLGINKVKTEGWRTTNLQDDPEYEYANQVANEPHDQARD